MGFLVEQMKVRFVELESGEVRRWKGAVWSLPQQPEQLASSEDLDAVRLGQDTEGL